MWMTFTQFFAFVKCQKKSIWNAAQPASQLSVLTVPNLSVRLEAYAAIRVIFSHTLFRAPAASLHAPSNVRGLTKARVKTHYGIVEFST